MTNKNRHPQKAGKTNQSQHRVNRTLQIGQRVPNEKSAYNSRAPK